MKELLDSLLEKINREMGLSLVFASLKASCQEILPQLSMKSSPQKQKSVKGGKTPLKKSPAKTATTSNTSSPSKSELRQMKIVERFQHWFNCLFLD